MYKEKVTQGMRVVCAHCKQEPKGTRIVMEMGWHNRYPTKEKIVWCNKTHVRNWMNSELKKVK